MNTYDRGRTMQERAHHFGRQLRVLRASRGMKQSELAEALELDASTISLWESGRRVSPPPMETVRQLEQILNSPPEMLVAAAGYPTDLPPQVRDGGYLVVPDIPDLLDKAERVVSYGTRPRPREDHNDDITTEELDEVIQLLDQLRHRLATSRAYQRGHRER